MDGAPRSLELTSASSVTQPPQRRCTNASNSTNVRGTGCARRRLRSSRRSCGLDRHRHRRHGRLAFEGVDRRLAAIRTVRSSPRPSRDIGGDPSSTGGSTIGLTSASRRRVMRGYIPLSKVSTAELAAIRTVRSSPGPHRSSRRPGGDIGGDPSSTGGSTIGLTSASRRRVMHGSTVLTRKARRDPHRSILAGPAPILAASQRGHRW